MDNEQHERARRFGEYVTAAARAAGYDVDSQRGGGRKRLAVDMGTGQSVVGRMLAGQTLPDAYRLETLARVLEVPLAGLLVLHGIAPEGWSPDSPPPAPKPRTPAQAARALGITTPRGIAVFEAMVEALRATDGM